MMIGTNSIFLTHPRFCVQKKNSRQAYLTAVKGTSLLCHGL
jgi:hypothetical protein